MSVINSLLSWENETINRKNIDSKNICTFGVKLLDDVFFGIMKKDFIVIGADSGAGKSELCLKIALHNAMNGRKVALYFIEGGDEEAIARIKWSLICDRYYTHYGSGIEMDYRKWRMNMISNPLLDKIEEQCRIMYTENIKDNLFLYKNPRGLTLEEFNESLDNFLKPEEGYEDDLLSYKYKVDLIIIDHLQYFTLTNPKNELTEQTQILKKVNEISHDCQIPIILVSHLRKKDNERGLPSQEDFYGTSNVPKMSSIAITITSDYSEDGINFPTYFRFVKTRTKIPANFALKSDFNITKGKYNDEYHTYLLIGNKLSETPLTKEKLPKFAVHSQGYVAGAKLLKDWYKD